jgi:RimJ/RimL family protein N-acetyltransferase
VIFQHESSTLHGPIQLPGDSDIAFRDLVAVRKRRSTSHGPSPGPHGDMSSSDELRTTRLLLRPCQQADVEPLARITADPRVMADLPAPLSRGECEALLERSHTHFRRHGFGLWAVEVPGQAPFIGLAGLWRVGLPVPVAPCVEIGWRLAPGHWGCGYATEAASTLLQFAFHQAALDEVVGFTVEANVRSCRVMEKLGMQRDPARDFAHPLLPADHPFRQQRLYRIDRGSWLGRATP